MHFSSFSSRQFKKYLKYILVLCGLTFSSQSIYASVVMDGKRIIYYSNNKSVDVHLKNRDNFPYIIQVWLDAGDRDSTAESKNTTPFMVTPPLSQIKAKEGQLLRIQYVGAKTLPQDRESIFYFNFLQIPPSNVSSEDDDDDNNKNKIIVTLRSRIKLFYRPKNLSVDSTQLQTLLNVKGSHDNKGYYVEIKNDSPFYVSLVSLVLKNKQGNTVKTEPSMISPFDKGKWYFPKAKINSGEEATVEVSFINDQGAVITYNYGTYF